MATMDRLKVFVPLAGGQRRIRRWKSRLSTPISNDLAYLTLAQPEADT